jgi:hypothetical protein
MPIRYTKTRVHFEDRCAVEEALRLVGFLAEYPRAKVTLAKCTGLHSALIQVLMAFRPTVLAVGNAPAIAHLAPHLLSAAPAAGHPDATE